MSHRTLKARRGGQQLAVLGFTAALLTMSAGALRAESSEAGLVGAWTVQVTLRDCATSAPIGAFNSLVTFHRGGTISENPGSLSFEAGQRSSGQGTWARKGDHTFRQRMIALILFDTEPNLPGSPTFDPSLPISPGFRAGWQTVTHTVEVVDADHYTSAGTNTFYDSSSDVYRTGCSTAVGQRFK